MPAVSVATTVIVFDPSVNVTVVENAPFAPTVTAVPLTLTTTGEDVISFVVPETVSVLLFVTKLLAGLVSSMLVVLCQFWMLMIL